MNYNIPVIRNTDNLKEDPMWASYYGNVLHPDMSHPTFFRYNLQNIPLFNWYNGDTVYIIARGPSIGKFLEDKQIHKMLLHPAIVKFGMNSSPDILDNQVNLWAAVDKVSKFDKSIMKNPNIMKFIPMNRFQYAFYGNKNTETHKTVAYKEDFHKYSCLCPNTVGVQSFLLEQHPKGQMSFGSAYLGSTAILYGYYKGIKSVFLFTLKLCILLGFKKVVLLGVDFNMNPQEPYYKKTAADFQKFHVDHNNNLYTTLSPIVKEIYNTLESGESGYTTKIVTANPIESMPFIKTINLKEELTKEIDSKS